MPKNPDFLSRSKEPAFSGQEHQSQHHSPFALRGVRSRSWLDGTVSVTCPWAVVVCGPGRGRNMHARAGGRD